MRKLLFAAALSVAVIAVPASAEAHNGYYRGDGCYSGACGPVYATTLATPAYGHLHAWGQCMVVRINKDWGNYVEISKAGEWRAC